MRFPRQLPQRLVLGLAALVALVLILLRYQEARISADPLYQLQHAVFAEMDTTDIAELVTHGVDSLREDASASRVHALLDGWSYLDGSLQQPPREVLVAPLQGWIRYALEQSYFDMASVQRIADEVLIPSYTSDWKELQGKLEQRLALFRAEVFYFDEYFSTGLPKDEMLLAELKERWLAFMQPQAYCIVAYADPVLQKQLQRWIGALEMDSSLLSLRQAITEVSAFNLHTVLDSARETDRSAFAWWLAFSMTLPETQRDAALVTRPMQQAYMLLWPQGAGTVWWLLLVAMLAALQLLLLAYWQRSGPRAVDPMAETLENVDPIDLDTEAVTMSNPGLGTDDHTTVNEQPLK